MTDQPNDPDITDAIRALEKGFFVREATRALAEATAAAVRNERPATVTLTFKITQTGTSPSGSPIIHITPDVAVKLPRPERAASVFYADDANGLFRQDPAQMFREPAPKEQ